MVCGADTARHQRVELGPQGAAQTDDADDVARERHRGDTEQAAPRKRHGGARARLQPRARACRRHEFVGEAELGRERCDRAAPGREALGSGVERDTAHDVRAHLAAEAVGRLGEGHPHTARVEHPRHLQSRDPATDHEHMRLPQFRSGGRGFGRGIGGYRSGLHNRSPSRVGPLIRQPGKPGLHNELDV